MKLTKPFIAGSLAIGLAAAGMSFGQQRPGAPVNQNDANRMTQPQVTFVAVGVYVPVRLPNLPAGFAPKDLRDGDDIREVAASATEAALTENGFNDLVERLVDQDRNRIGMNGFANKKFEILDGRTAQIRKAFKEKYGKEFDINKESAVFNDRYAIIQGEVSDPTLIAEHWPVPVTRQMTDVARSTDNEPAARPAAGQQEPTNPLKEDPIEARNLEKGRNVAIMGFPGMGNVPELHVSLIHELPNSWRIDIPNTISGQKLHDSLLENLTYVGEHVIEWPANADDARRMIGQYVIGALYDVHPQQVAHEMPKP